MRSRRKRRALSAILVIAVLGVVVATFMVVGPMGTEEAKAVYKAFPVTSGDIGRTLNFSGSVALKYLESHSTRNRTTVRQIFVKEEQQVKKGDKLLQLSNGELFRAGFDGVVNEIGVAVGDSVFPNMTLIQVCDLDRTQVEIQIDEYDMDKVYVGQPCTVTVLPLGASFETRITHISRISESTGAVARYTATAEVAVPENVLPGMQATVEMEWTKAADVETLDMQALAFDEESNPYVLKKTAEGTYERAAIEMGLNDGRRVEVVDGLQAGDVVYAVTGVEEEEEGFSIGAVYKKLFGENLVIIDRSGFAGGMGFPSGAMPEGMEGFPPEGVEDFPAEGAEGMQIPTENQGTEGAPETSEEMEETGAQEQSVLPEGMDTADGQGQFTQPEGMDAPDFPAGQRGDRQGASPPGERTSEGELSDGN